MQEYPEIKVVNFPPNTDFVVKIPTGNPKAPFYYIAGKTNDSGNCRIDDVDEDGLNLLEKAQENGELEVKFGQQPRKVDVTFNKDDIPCLVYSQPNEPETTSWIDKETDTLRVKIRRWIHHDKMPASGPTKIGAIFSIDSDIVKLAAEPIAAGQEYPIIEMTPEPPNADLLLVQKLVDIAVGSVRDLEEVGMFIEDAAEALGLDFKVPNLYELQEKRDNAAATPAKEAIEEMEAAGEKPIPLEDMKKKLNLEE